MKDWAISCVRVSKRFQSTEVLTGVDLEVEGRSITAILGASGSGKTTLLRIIMGFVRADSGTVIVAGRTMSEEHSTFVPPERRGIGYVAQEGALFPHLTVGQNISFGLSRSEHGGGPRVEELLELVGLPSGFSARQPHELSGGEQRRVALARALAPRPQLILLDEPFTGLDAALRAETRAAVVAALSNQGTASLLVTHDPAEAFSIGKQVAVLRDGRLVQTAAPMDVYQTPVDLDTARFVGDAVVLPGDANGDFVTCALGRLDLQRPLRGKVQVLLRPEQIQVSQQSSDQQATVINTTYYGRQTMVALTLDSAGGIEVAVSITEQELPAIGTKVGISVVGKVIAYPLKQ